MPRPLKFSKKGASPCPPSNTTPPSTPPADESSAVDVRQPATGLALQPTILPPSPPLLPEAAKRLTADDLRNRMAELCAKHNYDPIAEIMRIIEDGKGLLRTEMEYFADNIPEDIPKERLKQFIRGWAARIPHPEMKEVLSIHKELMQYFAPKLKATEVTTVADSSIHVTRKQYSSM